MREAEIRSGQAEPGLIVREYIYKVAKYFHLPGSVRKLYPESI